MYGITKTQTTDRCSKIELCLRRFLNVKLSFCQYLDASGTVFHCYACIDLNSSVHVNVFTYT